MARKCSSQRSIPSDHARNPEQNTISRRSVSCPASRDQAECGSREAYECAQAIYGFHRARDSTEGHRVAERSIKQISDYRVLHVEQHFPMHLREPPNTVPETARIAWALTCGEWVAFTRRKGPLQLPASQYLLLSGR